jgi:hypothetical protein
LPSIAFLAFRFDPHSAGYKNAADDAGSLQETKWEPAHVVRIAYLCEKYREELPKWGTIVARIKSGSTKLGDASDEVKNAESNPYLGNEALAPGMEAFGKLIDQSPQAMKDLERDNDKRLEYIKKFKDRLDRSDKEVTDLDARERNGEIKVDDAYRSLAALSSDPYVRPDVLASAIEGFRILIDLKRLEITAIETNNRRIFTGIADFKRNYDIAVHERLLIALPGN